MLFFFKITSNVDNCGEYRWRLFVRVVNVLLRHVGKEIRRQELLLQRLDVRAHQAPVARELSHAPLDLRAGESARV